MVGMCIDDSGVCAVFTEQGSSQRTVEKIMQVIVRLLDCDGDAVVALSTYTHVKMEYAQKVTKT